MTVDNIKCGTAAVVTVQCGCTLQADRQVAGLAEEPELLAGMEGAQDRTAETTSRLQLLQTLNRVRRCSLLPPADTTQNRYSTCLYVRIKIEFDRKENIGKGNTTKDSTTHLAAEEYISHLYMAVTAPNRREPDLPANLTAEDNRLK